MPKQSQRLLALELLKDNAADWLPAWAFVGEKYINGEYHLLSYSVPKRLSELYNDGLLDRQLVKGKSGAYYYEYRLKIQGSEL